MKLIYRILIRLSLALLAVLTVWTVFFYFTMIDEINDEVDDALEDYSETIIIRSLAGKELPSKNDGSNNSYSIRPITREEARQYPAIEYYDADIYIKEKEETEPARVLRTIFADKDDNYFLLEVSTPSFEKEDLREAVANWILFLYIVLQVKFFVDEKELDLIKQKMAQMGTENMSAYLRKMAIDGYVVNLDMPELRELTSKMKRISNSENQIAKQLNTSGNIYEADIEEIKKNQEEIYEGIKKILCSLSHLK